MALSKTAKYYRENPDARKKKADYDSDYQKSDTQVKNRVARNRARRRAMKKGRVRKGDGKDLHHANGINSDKVVVMDASKNRGMAEKSRLKGSRRRKRRRTN